MVDRLIYRMNHLSPNDKMNLTFFTIVMVISIVGIFIDAKVKLPVWKIQVILILFYDFLAVVLLASQLLPL